MSQDNPNQGAARRHSFLLEFLGSMNLAITLLVVVAIAAVIGTVLQQNQAYQDYILKFGPFWFEFFDALGLFDVYTAGWFLSLLTFMVLSISVCIYRNIPHVLHDMRQYREHARLKSLRAFHHKHEWQVSSADALLETAQRLLKGRGYQFKRVDGDDHVMVAAKKGSLGRLGYLFTHGAIVLICVGGLIDGNVMIKFREWTGDLRPETRNIAASQVPEASKLSLDNPSFRSSITIPEGRVSRVSFLGLRDGYLVQPLPFSIEVKDFRIEHYATGQPKSFESDLVVRNLDNPDEQVEQTIRVNHPLSFMGYTIYQASFGDGGSKLDLKAWPLNGQGESLTLQGEIDTAMPLSTGSEKLSLELVDFKMINVNPVEDPDDPKAKRNFGPSYNFKLRDATGQAVEYFNYMLPVELDGRMVYLSGMRTSTAESYRYLHIPADPKGQIDRFMMYRARLLDQQAVAAAARDVVEQMMGGDTSDPKAVQRMLIAMHGIIRVFADKGFDGLLDQIEATVPEEQREEVRGIYQRSLEHMLSVLYIQTLEAEGIDVQSAGVSEADAKFFDNAVIALGSLPMYGSPYYLQLTGFDHIQATGLQISKTPGKTLVYLGCVLLCLGIFLMFYLPHKRLWLRVETAESGGGVVFAGATPRNAFDFNKEFEAMAGYLEQKGEE